MGYNAPDPQQFAGMEQAYSIMAPSAAVLITMPAFVIGGPVTHISRIVFMNQCNPGKIMRIGAEWLQLTEKYLAAADQLEEEIGKIQEGEWEGKDRDAFNEKSQQVIEQLKTIGAYSLLVGIQLIAIASMLAVMVPFMLAVATMLQVCAVLILGCRAVPPPAGQVMEMTLRANVTAIAMSNLAALKALDEAISVAAKALAAAMTAEMSVSWTVLAANGNVVNPVDTLGSTGFSMLQGLAQMTIRNLMAPGRTGTGTLGKVSPKLDGALAKAGPGMVGFAGGQGLYNIGNNSQAIADPDARNAMKEAGIDVGNLDFVPNNHGFEDAARGAGTGDAPPEWSVPGPEEKGAPESS
ncbi:hypothetical protein [Glycomyces tarimensis]